ncbi:MAG: VCBS repeat-containing protein [Acidobacteria bacterium]|nr:VCBS repeat-containing protein [Acidobacteriota bacterium]
MTGKYSWVTAKAVSSASNQYQARQNMRGLVLLVCLAFALPAMAGWIERQKITSSPRGVGAQFGNAVAINGNTMVVGARFDSTTASQAGAAYVFVLSGGTWTQQAVLLANDGATSDKFGYSVAISEDTIVVGAYNDDSPFSNAGSAYVFVRSGTSWSFQQKLTASDAAADDQFGVSVAIGGPTIFVGANFSDQPSNSDAGAVYRFSQSGMVWTQTQKLVPIGGVILGDHFGESVATSGNKLVVGSPGADIPFTAAGSVYVFIEGGGGVFTMQDKISIPGGANGDSFGASVAIEGNTFVGGATQYSPVVGQTAYGAAYVYEFNGAAWVSQGRLVADDGGSVDRFGWSVAVSDNTIAVGARDDDTVAGGTDAGSAYVFVRSGANWGQQQKIAPPDPFNGDRFGSGVALSFGNLVVGAAEKALSAPNGQGAAYYFVRPSKVRYDFDGDGISDISIFRPVSGQWWYQRSSDSTVRAETFGTSTDRPVPADYDGDGKTDIAVYRPSSGTWYVLRSSNLSFYSLPFGISTDKAVPADFDGDGLADVSVFRPSEGAWYINKSSGGVQVSQWGSNGDVPVTSDYDGDGKADLAIFRPSNGQWWLNRSTAGTIVHTFGNSADKPVPADYTGDGKADIAVWRASNGSWYVLRSEDSSYYSAPFGNSGDVPAPADFDGDGRADIGIFRPDGSNWFIQRSTQGILIQQFGAAGDIPAPSAYIP